MKKGQVQLATLGYVALTAGITWLGGYLLNSPVQSANSISTVQTNIAVLQKSDMQQDKSIEQISKNLEKLNDNLTKLLVANGIQPSK